jgi:hypothetical protein
MLIASTEGQGWRYEVIVQSDGFLVQARDLDTGEVAGDDTTLFRTGPVALAYAGMAAAADRFASANLADDDDDEDLAGEFRLERDRFTSMRTRLADEGVGALELSRRLGGGLRETPRRLQ